MILKGSQRGGGRALAAHLMNHRENDHVTVHELRGFVAEDLRGAFDEIRAIAKGTKSTQPFFSLSFSPPKDADASLETMIDAADRAERMLGLSNQPRAIVGHEKAGRRHLRVVWGRIDTEMKAIQLSFFKNRLNELSKELYLENGWELPEGHRTSGWKSPLNFTQAEWQQAKRLDLDPREIKQIFNHAFTQADNQKSFRAALEYHGYFLAKGDRRGFVALDIQGETFSVARWAGIKTKELTAKMGMPDGLPSVDDERVRIREALESKVRARVREEQALKQEELAPIVAEVKAMVKTHRAERGLLNRKLEQRHNEQGRDRAARFKRGLGAVLDFLTGRAAQIRQQNEKEAYDSFLRDKALREHLFHEQMRERQCLQQRLDAVQAKQRERRLALARNFATALRAREHSTRGKNRGFNGLEL